MGSVSRLMLSGSTNGRPIKVAATATPGTTVHTALAGTTGIDEVYLWVTNADTAARDITAEFGGTTDPDDRIVYALSIPAKSGPIPIVPGLCLQNALVIKAFGSVANKLLISGYVNRIN